MNQKDRDRFIQLFVFYDFLREWVKDNDTDLQKVDKDKIFILLKTTIKLMQKIGELEGVEAIESLMNESKNLKFAILPKDENLPLINTFEHNILKSSIKKVIKNCTECDLCAKKDYRYCELFTIKKFLNEEEINKKKKQCPYKVNVENLFNFEDDL